MAAPDCEESAPSLALASLSQDSPAATCGLQEGSFSEFPVRRSGDRTRKTSLTSGWAGLSALCCSWSLCTQRRLHLSWHSQLRPSSFEGPKQACVCDVLFVLV